LFKTAAATSSAGSIIAFHKHSGDFENGETGLICSFGAGYSAGAVLTALLHDAAEYVIGDMISPFKHALGIDYKAFEARLEEAIHLRYGLSPKMPPSLKTARGLRPRKLQVLIPLRPTSFLSRRHVI